MLVRRFGGLACAGLMAVAASPAARAGSFQFGEATDVEYKLTFTYAAAMRTKNPDDAIINGPMDPLKGRALVTDQAGVQHLVETIIGDPSSAPAQQIVAFEHTGLPDSINFDDGDRNFRAGDLFNNRLTAFGEVHVTHENYGALANGTVFWDQVFHDKNSNDGPNTINKLNAEGGIDHEGHDQFTEQARYFNGQRARMLEWYGYGDWQFGDESALNVRLGKHLTAWGESLFFPGITSAQGPNDATKAFVPGAEIKEILLPVTQLSFQLAFNNSFTWLGFYQLEFKPTEIFPVGDFFSPADVVGPGAVFTYGSINPAYANGCPGLFDPATPAEAVCNLGTINPALGGQGATVFNAEPFILVPRGPDIKPSKWGIYGSGLKWAATDTTTLGFFFIRYANHNPNVQLNPGCAQFGTVNGRPFTTCDLNQVVPVTYNIKYFGGIKMGAVSFTTVMGIFNIAGEFIYRDGIDTAVEATISGVRSPVPTRGVTNQVNLSALYVSNPKLWYDEIVVVAETAYLRVKDVDRVDPSPGVIPAADGRQLFYDKSSWGLNVLTLLKKRDALPAWDFLTTINAGSILKGNPSVPGTFGALFGEGDTRLGVGIGMQYIQNLEFDLGYNFFFGDPAKRIHGTILHANPYADRDNVTFSVKYSL